MENKSSNKNYFAIGAAFVIGGILGFLLHGQLVNDKMMRSGYGEEQMPHPARENSDREGRNPFKGKTSENLTFDEYKDVLPAETSAFIDRTVEELELTESQQEKIERIIQQNIPQDADITKMSKSKLMRMSRQINKELTPEQEEKLREIMLDYSNLPLIKF